MQLELKSLSHALLFDPKSQLPVASYSLWISTLIQQQNLSLLLVYYELIRSQVTKSGSYRAR